MKIIKAIFLSGIFLSLFLPAEASGFKNETLKYVISYKWGLIHKDAGEATLRLVRNGGNYDIVLAAHTKPWADKFYKVRDTLKTSLRVADLKPLLYEKITHEKNEYKRDVISYSYTGSATVGHAKRFRYDKGKQSVTEVNLSAEGPVYDMLSIFYYLRNLDYSPKNFNKIYTATVFSGRRKETVKIRCLGVEKIKLKDNTVREALHLRFNFTRDGGKKSSEDIDTWISTDGEKIPLYLTAKLPIGEIRAYLQK